MESKVDGCKYKQLSTVQLGRGKYINTNNHMCYDQVKHATTAKKHRVGYECAMEMSKANTRCVSMQQ